MAARPPGQEDVHVGEGQDELSDCVQNGQVSGQVSLRGTRYQHSNLSNEPPSSPQA